MKALPWILVGVGVGIATTVLLFNGSGPEYFTGYDGVESAARKSFGWGAKQQAEGKVGSFAGAIKRGVGQLTGNEDLANEGTADRVAGGVKDAAGQLGQAVGQTIHDLNR
ncbi:MAG: CsbD family protein [Acidobacteriota bacterium]|nr:CsbD family protein [Acidobacteriota bacterium]